MSGILVMDADGNLKYTGSGSTLPDPVTVVHGGTGITTATKGDILYASAANTLAKLAIDTAGVRILANTGAAGFDVPAWTDPSLLGAMPKPTTRKFAFLSGLANVGTTPTATEWVAPTATNTAALVDSTSAWVRGTTAASAGSQAGIRLAADWVRIDHLPRCECYIRTGSVITNLRFSFLVSNTATLPTNADDQSALKGVGIRYSTVAGDTGFTPWTADGTTQTTGTVIAAIAASTVYQLTIVVTSTTSVSFSVNGSASQTLTIGAGALATNLRMQLCVTTTTASAKALDFKTVYGEWN